MQTGKGDRELEKGLNKLRVTGTGGVIKVEDKCQDIRTSKESGTVDFACFLKFSLEHGVWDSRLG